MYGASGEGVASFGARKKPSEGASPCRNLFDASRSLTALEQDSTIVAVIEMSKAKWLIAGLVPGLERQPLKKIDADAERC